MLEGADYYCKFIARPIPITNFRVRMEVFDCDISSPKFEPSDAIMCFEAGHSVLMVCSGLIIILYFILCARFMFVGSDLSYMEVC